MNKIKPKQSNYKAPREAKHAQFVWAPGAKPYPESDHWGTAMIAVACLIAGIVIGALVVA